MAGRIVFNMNVSLDGRVAGPGGELDWAAHDDEAHRLFNEELNEMGGGFLLGRRMYEMLQAAFGSTKDLGPTDEVTFPRIWHSKPKYVFSRTLERVDDSAILIREATRKGIERIKAEAAGDLSVGGPGLAGGLIELGLVDEFWMYVFPVVLGGGLPYLPALARPLSLRLGSATPLRSGVVRLAYTA